VPLWLKLVFSAFLAVLVPVYWYYYGPTNFLYFCDVALILTLVGLWIESPLLISMCAVGLLAPQTLWVVDFVMNFFGVSLVGMTAYMFNHDSSLFLRGLSLFHGWLPFLLVILTLERTPFHSRTHLPSVSSLSALPPMTLRALAILILRLMPISHTIPVRRIMHDCLVLLRGPFGVPAAVLGRSNSAPLSRRTKNGGAREALGPIRRLRLRPPTFPYYQ